MSPDELFKIRYEKLGGLLTTGKAEDLIDLSLLLRQLLIDASPLVHVVNRKHRLKLEFQVGKSAREMDEGREGIGLMSFTRYPSGGDGLLVPLDKLLAHEVLGVQGKFYTNHQILTACAHQLGGVHLDTKADEDDVVQALKQFSQIAGVLPGMHMFAVMQHLANTTHAGLAPLYQAVCESIDNANDD